MRTFGDPGAPNWIKQLIEELARDLQVKSNLLIPGCDRIAPTMRHLHPEIIHENWGLQIPFQARVAQHTLSDSQAEFSLVPGFGLRAAPCLQHIVQRDVSSKLHEHIEVLVGVHCAAQPEQLKARI